MGSVKRFACYPLPLRPAIVIASRNEKGAKKKMFDLENKSKKINTIQLKERSEGKKIRQRMKMFQ